MSPSCRKGAWLAASLLTAVLGGCQRGTPPGLVGYIEGEYLYLAAPQAGYLKSLDAARGSRVTAGQALFAIASDPDAQALDALMAAQDAGRLPQVWVLDNGQPKAITVQVGASNGRQTEITGGELKSGMAVITDYQEAKK